MKARNRLTAILVLAALLASLAGCATILSPDPIHRYRARRQLERAMDSYRDFWKMGPTRPY